MMWLKNLTGALGFRTMALRALADGQSVWAGITCYVVGYLAYVLIRGFVYGPFVELEYGRSGLLPAGRGVDLAQELVFLLFFLVFMYVPTIVALSNAFSDDGLGLSFSATEYRAHLAVLFPIWGSVCLITAPLQWLSPLFQILGGIIEGSVIYLLRALLLGGYTFWAVMRLNYLSPIRTCGIFAISVLAVPIFFAISSFIWSLPFLFLIPLLYFAIGWIRNLGAGRIGDVDFQRNMKALTVNPQNADVHYQLGRINLDRGNPDAANRYFEAAVKISRQVAEYYYYFGLACERKNDWVKALECYENAYRLDAEYGQGDIFREVGKAYLNTGSVEKGKEFLNFFLSRRDADPEGRYWLADALRKSGDANGARLQLTLIIEQAKANPRFFRKRNREWIYRARNLIREINQYAQET